MLCVSLLSLVVFSVGVSAKSVDVPAFEVSASHRYSYGGESSSLNYLFTPRNGVTEKSSSIYSGTLTSNGSTPVKLTVVIGFYPTNTDYFIKSGDSTTMELKNIFLSTAFHIGGKKNFYNSGYSKRLLLFYSDGTMEYVDNVTGGESNPVFTFTPKKNVVSFEYILSRDVSLSSGTVFQIEGGVGEWSGDTTHEISINQESEDTGLLKGIGNWLSKLWDGIINIPSNVFNSFKGALDGISDWISSAVTAITELPSKIWSFIEDGLKSLFVPDDEFITGYKDDFDSLLSEKFGAVYQVVNITFGSLERIQDADELNSIELPETTINLPDNNKFSFGGVTVPIVPQGFDGIVNVLKTIVGIVCTILFINGLRKRYDEVMGVEQ